jgi:hypothetical protein
MAAPRILSLLFGLCCGFFFITISDAAGSPDQPIARRSSEPDLPVRNLTQYVRTLMGTDAFGDGKSHGWRFLIFCVPGIHNSVRNGKSRSRQQF